MKKIALTLVIILLLMGGIGAGIYLVQQQTEFREKAAPNSTLTLVPSSTTPEVDETFTVAANIDTGTNQVLGVELHLTFDETKVEALGASNSTFFTSPKNVGPSIDNNNGTLTYTVYIDPGTSPRQGQGTVAVLTFKAKAAGNTTISLSSETNVAADNTSGDLGQNVLSGTTPAVLNIQSSTAPTPTSTSTPTPTTTSGGGSTSTPTPTIGSVSAATNTPTPTTASGFSTATPTQATLPDSGVSVPTALGIGIGVLVLVGSMLLAL